MSEQAKLFDFSRGVQEKRDLCNRMVAHLKSKFVGIDDVIDRIGSLMEPWLVMPEAQSRPMICCLWGMTGCGKTSLVREIASFLASPLIQVDLGEYTERKRFATEFYSKFSEFSGEEVVILLDEIQNPRTISDSGKEIDREGLRGLWSLLSDGKIYPDECIDKDHYILELEDNVEKYDACGGVPPRTRQERAEMERQLGCEPDDDDDDIIAKAVSDDDDDDDDDDDEKEDVLDPRYPPWYMGEWEIKNILELCNKCRIPVQREMRSLLRADWKAAATKMLQWLYELETQPKLDYTKSIIFITGNLDEVYVAARSMNPDITADELHEWSLEITVPQIKQSLLRRFRAEQIARLGNNHLLYPAFSEQSFRDIIKLDLKRISDTMRERYDVELSYDHSVEDLIYLEGVFPTQGARPVLSTTSSVVETSIPKCFVEVVRRFENNPLSAPVAIQMSADRGLRDSSKAQARFALLDDPSFQVAFPIDLSVDILRRPVYDDEHVSIAIHECGHAVNLMMEMGVVPLKVCAFSPNADDDGYTLGQSDTWNLDTKADILRDMIVSLGGWAAERVVLGEDNLGLGCSCDLMRASKFAADYVQEDGFDDVPVIKQRPASTEDCGITLQPRHEAEIERLVKIAGSKAEQNVRANLGLLLEMTCLTLSSPHADASQIKDLAEKHQFKFPQRRGNARIFEDQLEEHGIEWAAQEADAGD